MNRSLSVLDRVALAMVLSASCLAGCSGPTAAVHPAAPASTSTPANVASPRQGALASLKQGNERFVRGTSAGKRQSLLAGQKPLAVVICCSDSRVGPELVFGQGLGDIFVVRVAGNVVDPVVQGSVEYAVEHLHAPLIVVMGHDDCEAVKAAVADDHATGANAAVVGRIRGSVEAAESQGLKGDAAVNAVTDLNIKASIQEISASPIVSKALAKGSVKIVGARYHLASGRVEWLETKPSPATTSAPAK